MKLKNLIKFLTANLVFVLFVNMQSSFAYYDPELAKAFASFIETMTVSVHSANKGAAICIYGSDDITVRLQSGSKNVITLEHEVTSKKNRYQDCKIIYVAKDNEKFAKSFIATFNKSGALTIAAFDSFVNDGGMVFIDLGRRDFELTINVGTFKASGIKLDSAIAALIINNKQ